LFSSILRKEERRQWKVGQKKEIKDKNLMAPWGLYCGACGVYIATRDKNEKFMEVMGNLYGTKAQDTQCHGCMQADPPKKLYGYCAMCAIRVGALSLPCLRESAVQRGGKIVTLAESEWIEDRSARGTIPST
jgi:hypothetical protein